MHSEVSCQRHTVAKIGLVVPVLLIAGLLGICPRFFQGLQYIAGLDYAVVGFQ
jgi:hypothetical protein